MTKWVSKRVRDLPSLAGVKTIEIKEPQAMPFDSLGAPDTRHFNKKLYYLMQLTKFGVNKSAAYNISAHFERQRIKTRTVPLGNGMFAVYFLGDGISREDVNFGRQLVADDYKENHTKKSSSKYL